MRLLVNLSLENENAVIPFDHQYALASLIYKKIGEVDPAYFNKLHSSRSYKFFTFSYLMSKKRTANKEGIEIKNGKAYFFVSSPDKNFVKTLVEGLLEFPEVSIRGVKGFITQIKILKKPKFKHRMKFRTLSPILVRKPVKKEGKLRALDLYPTDEEFVPRLIANLKKKFSSFHGKEVSGKEFNIRFLKFKPKRHRIMKTYHRCVLGEFVAEGDENLMELGYEAGFGEKNSMGFGMVKVI